MMTPVDPDTPITVGDVNQLTIAFAVAMLLYAAVVVEWVIGEERGNAKAKRRVEAAAMAEAVAKAERRLSGADPTAAE